MIKIYSNAYTTSMLQNHIINYFLLKINHNFIFGYTIMFIYKSTNESCYNSEYHAEKHEKWKAIKLKVSNVIHSACRHIDSVLLLVKPQLRDEILSIKVDNIMVYQSSR